MDQYPFDFKLTVAGTDVDDFIKALKLAGLESQAKEVQEQFEKELNAFGW